MPALWREGTGFNEHPGPVLDGIGRQHQSSWRVPNVRNFVGQGSSRFVTSCLVGEERQRKDNLHFSSCVPQAADCPAFSPYLKSYW